MARVGDSEAVVGADHHLVAAGPNSSPTCWARA